MANHSVPNPLEVWDCNVDHIADMGCVDFHRSGVPWTAEAATRILAAANEWKNDTDFNLDENTSAGQAVYRDRYGCGLTTWLQPEGLVFAATCRTKTWDGVAEWWRNSSVKTYFNHRLPDFGLQWYYGAGVPPNPNQVHFGGIAVHEFGHWIRLQHAGNCNPGPTMCASVDNTQESFDIYSLDADDIASANLIY